MANNSISFTMNYSGTDFTRNMTISDVADSIAAAPANIKSTFTAINSSLSGGTSGGMDTFFRSDDYDDSDAQNVVGKLNKLTSLKLIVVTEEIINLD